MLSVLVFLIAMLYASVGHGGASGYLSVLGLTPLPPQAISTSALILNLLVSGTSWQSYLQAGHYHFRLVWPFLLASIPAAFIGGWLHISGPVYYTVLGVVLLFASARTAWPDSTLADTSVYRNGVPLPAALLAGGGIGLISGMIGIGGGIFLSPLMILFRWADAKQTAAASAFFILINSLSALAGRLASGNLIVGHLWPLLIAGFIGGLLGSYMGAFRISMVGLRRLLAIVLLAAAVKMMSQAF